MNELMTLQEIWEAGGKKFPFRAKPDSTALYDDRRIWYEFFAVNPHNGCFISGTNQLFSYYQNARHWFPVPDEQDPPKLPEKIVRATSEQFEIRADVDLDELFKSFNQLIDWHLWMKHEDGQG